MMHFVRAFGLHQPDRTACGQPISTSEAHALGVLDDAGAIRLAQLADELVLEKSTVSRLVSSLRGRGWVRLDRDPSDGRARLVKLTASGRRAATRLKAARSTLFDTVLARIDPDRHYEVISALAELTEAARSAARGETGASGS